MVIAAVRFRAKLAGLPDPVGPIADRAHKGFRRAGRNERGRGQAPALDLDAIREIAGQCPPLDRAIVLTMFQACLRRSEAAALEWRDIEKEDAVTRRRLARTATAGARAQAPLRVDAGAPHPPRHFGHRVNRPGFPGAVQTRRQRPGRRGGTRRGGPRDRGGRGQDASASRKRHAGGLPEYECSHHDRRHRRAPSCAGWGSCTARTGSPPRTGQQRRPTTQRHLLGRGAWSGRGTPC